MHAGVLVAVVGPTGSGKSALALHLAKTFDGEIVNCDSRQIYRGFDMGTAKPSREARAEIPHHLFDIIEPEEAFSAGEFMRRADAAIADIFSRGRLPILAGGTGFYLRALLDGTLSEGACFGMKNLEIEARLERLYARRGLAFLRRMLERVDPTAAARISSRDTQRTLRFLEIYFTTGKPASVHWAEQERHGPRYPDAVKIGLRLPRKELRKRQEERIEQMLQGGWLDEIRGLLARGLTSETKAMESHGYRELAAWVEAGAREETFAAAVEAVRRVHRQYAKRQETWFRRDKDIHWLNAMDSERFGTAEKIVAQALCSNGVGTP